MDVHVHKKREVDRKTSTAHCSPSDTMSKRHRATLSFAEKHAVLLKCQSLGVQGGRKRIREVQSWARTTFKLRKEPLYRTVMSIVKNETVFIECMNLDGYLRKKVWSNRSNAVTVIYRLPP